MGKSAKTPFSSVIGFVLAAALAVPAMIVILDRLGSGTPTRSLELRSATGRLAITNSLEGQAVLSAPSMVPGQSATGTVTLMNTGDGPEQLTLGSASPLDTPGPHGGHLSTRLRLVVSDVTQPGQDDVVYSGPVTSLDDTGLGAWQTDEQRTYRFTVTFLEGGADGADNAYQGSSASISFAWTATEAGSTTTTPTTGASYEQEIHHDGPLAWWRLADTGATLADADGAYDGTLKNGVRNGQAGIDGTNAAAYFDGVATYAMANGITAPRHGYSLEAWVKPVSTGDGTIVEQGGAGSIAVKGGHFAFREVDTVVTAPAPLRAGLWQHVVATWDGATASLYVDGALAASAPASTAPSGAATVYIGHGAFAPWFKGDIDEVAYYATPLSAARIAGHYAAGQASVLPAGTGTGPSASRAKTP